MFWPRGFFVSKNNVTSSLTPCFISLTNDHLNYNYLEGIFYLKMFLLSVGLSVWIVENAASCLSSKPIISLHLNQRGHYSAHSAPISEITGRNFFLYQRNMSGTITMRDTKNIKIIRDNQKKKSKWILRKLQFQSFKQRKGA